MNVYVLAAGYATRLYPLTRDCAKPLLEVGGRPVLSRIVDRLLALPDLDEVVVVANRRFACDFDAWRRNFAGPARLRVLDDGSTCEEDRLGAIGDLAFALQRVPTGASPFVAIAGDNLIEFDLTPLYRAFLEGGRPLLVLREVERVGGPTRYNEVAIDAEGGVRRFREKPPDPTSALAAISLYFFTAEVAALLERYLAEGGRHDEPGHFIAWLVEQTPVASAGLPGEWFDIGSLETLEQARRRFAAAAQPPSGDPPTTGNSGA